MITLSWYHLYRYFAVSLTAAALSRGCCTIDFSFKYHGNLDRIVYVLNAYIHTFVVMDSISVI